jgi:hypothetical protein
MSLVTVQRRKGAKVSSATFVLLSRGGLCLLGHCLSTTLVEGVLSQECCMVSLFVLQEYVGLLFQQVLGILLCCFGGLRAIRVKCLMLAPIWVVVWRPPGQPQPCHSVNGALGKTVREDVRNIFSAVGSRHLNSLFIGLSAALLCLWLSPTEVPEGA